MIQHLVLLGDSILDNKTYTRPELDTADHLQRALGSKWNVALLARDGATMADLRFQLSYLPPSPEFAILSIGGNDALEHLGMLDLKQTTNHEVYAALHNLGDDFGKRYRTMLASVVSQVRRLVVCTIYEPSLGDPRLTRLARVPLTVLNDQIVREAGMAGCDVLDLRTVCTDTRDFIKEIEPSASGAAKIAAAIHGIVNNDSPVGRHFRFFAR